MPGRDALAALSAEAGIPAGTILATARATAPPGYLMCDGSAVSRSVYADLFDAIRTNYGVGNGTTTFTLPDMRGRTPVGADGGAGRVADDNALGESAGADDHQLSIAEMPVHSHAIAPGVNFVAGGAGNNWVGTGASFSLYSGGNSVTNTGADGSHNNMQPYQVVNYMVKT